MCHLLSLSKSGDCRFKRINKLAKRPMIHIPFRRKLMLPASRLCRAQHAAVGVNSAHSDF